MQCAFHILWLRRHDRSVERRRGVARATSERKAVRSVDLAQLRKPLALAFQFERLVPERAATGELQGLGSVLRRGRGLQRSLDVGVQSGINETHVPAIDVDGSDS